MSRGILLFAHNNGLIDYGDMASYCAEHILANMDPRPICLVTDSETRKTVDRKLFNQIIEVEPDETGTTFLKFERPPEQGKQAVILGRGPEAAANVVQVLKKLELV